MTKRLYYLRPPIGGDEVSCKQSDLTGGSLRCVDYIDVPFLVKLPDGRDIFMVYGWSDVPSLSNDQILQVVKYAEEFKKMGRGVFWGLSFTLDVDVSSTAPGYSISWKKERVEDYIAAVKGWQSRPDVKAALDEFIRTGKSPGTILPVGFSDRPVGGVARLP